MFMFEFFGTLNKKVGDEFIYVNAKTLQDAIVKMLNGKPVDADTPIPTARQWELSKYWV